MFVPGSETLASTALGIMIWLALTWSLGQAGGWSRMADHYRGLGRVPTRRFHFRSARFGSWVGYSGALTFGTSAQGLHLSVWPIFRAGHPPLFIPWSDLSAAPGQTRWLPTVRFAAARCGDVPITTTRAMAERLAGESGGALVLPAP